MLCIRHVSHELTVRAEGGGSSAHCQLSVTVGDVNDNAPYFPEPHPVVTVIEEDDRDLPLPLVTVSAVDVDWIDREGLLYTLTGDGVDGLSPEDAFFSVDSNTGQLTQLRPLDRDPPHGRPVWKLRVGVSDGQKRWRPVHAAVLHPLPPQPSAPQLGVQSFLHLASLHRTPPETAALHRTPPEAAALHHAPPEAAALHRAPPEAAALHRAPPETAALLRAQPKASAVHHDEPKFDYLNANERQPATPLRTLSESHAQHPLSAPSDPDIQQRSANKLPASKRRSLTKSSKFLQSLFKSDIRGSVATRSHTFLASSPDRSGKLQQLASLAKAQAKTALKPHPPADLSVQHPDDQNSAQLIWRNSSVSRITGFHVSSQFQGLSTSPPNLSLSLSSSLNNSFSRNSAQLYPAHHFLDYPRLQYSDSDLSNNFQKFRIKNRSNVVPPLSYRNSDINKKLDTDFRGSDDFIIHPNSEHSDDHNILFTDRMNPDRSLFIDNQGNNRSTKQSQTWSRRLSNQKNYEESLDSAHSKSLLPGPKVKISEVSRFPKLVLHSQQGNKNKKKHGRSRRLKYSSHHRWLLNLKRNSPYLLRKRRKRDLSKNSYTPRVPDSYQYRNQVQKVKDNHLQITRITDTGVNKETYALQSICHMNYSLFFCQRKLKLIELLKLSKQTWKEQNEINLHRQKSSAVTGNLPSSNPSFQAASKILPKKFIKHMASSSHSFRNVDSSNTHQNFAPLHLPSDKGPSLTTRPCAPHKSYNTECASHLGVGEEAGASPSSDFSRENTTTSQSWPSYDMHSQRRRRSPGEGGSSAGVLLTSGGCIKPPPLLPNSNDDFNVAGHNDVSSHLEQYQRLLWTSEVERGVWRRIHVVEAEVTIIVKDINDNSPVFPESLIYGDVQENGPIDLSVVTVQAHDADDSTEGSNARLLYAIEKNVLDEKTGAPMFQVDPETGVVSTALCCLDRETTPEYQLQVVATDGGGLKGTGTVMVRLTDVNDNPPTLSRSEYEVEIPETWGRGPPDDQPILDLTVTDADVSNHFFYEVRSS
ncbi:Cadherin [Trinorchestia longiramus]|nr:Cadherin [Trinorchestia longiramus]